MKKVILFFFLSLLVTSVSAQFSTFYISETSDLQCVSSVNDHDICVGGQGGIWKSTDNGLSWLKVFSSYYVREIRFLGQTNIGYAVSNNLTPYSTKVIKTTNGGINWVNCYTTSDTVTFNEFYIKNQNEVFASFDGASYNRDAALFRSVNGGFDWEIVYQVHIYSFKGITGDGNGNIHVAGSQLFSFNDSNFAYCNYQNVPTAYVFSNSVSVNNKLYVAGDSYLNNNFYPTIAYTINNGVNWEVYTFPDSGECHYINFSNNNIGYAVGTTRYTNYYWLATDNGGNSWEKIYGTTTSSVYAISPTSRYVYFVGSDNPSGNGIIIRYDSPLTKIKNNEHNLKEFNLQQNFPNPFNPVTKIQYQIQKTVKVLLKVFDISGREIATLLDQTQNAGTHDVRFDGSKLSSGIYFYHLQAGEYSQTKKMMLIK